MRKSRDTKVNTVGQASCLMLFLLLMTMVYPVALPTAFAEETPTDSIADPDAGMMTMIDDASTVGISFSPTSGSTSLTPTTSAGQSAQVNVLATVNVADSGGYSVYVKSDTQNLVGKKSTSKVIPGIRGSVTYGNLETNTWGYYAGEGTAVPENATYKAISVTGNGDKIAENTSSKIVSDTKKIMLSFAAKIGDNIPADTYQNTVTMSVVSSPLKIIFDDIATMQQMTSRICEDAKIDDMVQLRDTRDGKYYWVTKLKDNKCWMTQNLDLDLSTSKALTLSDSDVPSSWTPGYSTSTQATSATILADDKGTRSWSLGNYRITNPTSSSDCGSKKNSLTDCPSQFTVYDTPTTPNEDETAHYIAGNHYQWNAATAGTGGAITGGQAAGSICPKGWRLPTSAGGDLKQLLDSYSIGLNVAALSSSPLYFVRGGYVYQGTSLLFAYAGDAGYYWSSTPASSSKNAYNLGFWSSNDINPSYNTYNRYVGFSVRCVAR